jgi:hypothetical protein
MKKVILNAEEREYQNYYENLPHETQLGWCCACEYDIILLNERIRIAKEILIDEIKDLVNDEIALAHTTVSGKTSRLTSLAVKIYAIKDRLKKDEKLSRNNVLETSN